MAEQVQITQITEQGPVVVHPETMSNNVLHMGGTIDKMLTIGGQPQHNINFEKDEVVQDGLIEYLPHINRHTYISNNPIKIEIDQEFIAQGYFSEYERTNPSNKILQLINIGALNIGIDSSGIPYCQGTQLGIPYTSFGLPTKTSGEYYISVVIKDKKTVIIKFTINNKTSMRIVTANVDLDVTSNIFFFNSSNQDEWEKTYANILVYRSQLITQEIAHNIQILTNHLSISKIHISDKADNKIKFVLAADSDHVVMPDSRNLRQFAYECLDWEEKVSDGSPILLDNAKIAWVKSAELQGQTMKNYAPTMSIATLIANGSWVLYNTGPFKRIEKNKKYKVVAFVYENTLNGRFLPLDGGSAAAQLAGSLIVSAGQTGVFSGVLTSKETGTSAIYSTIPPETTSGSVKFQVIVMDETSIVPNLYIPFGLSSTIAQISVNGQATTFYASEEDKMNNKPIKLAKIGDVSDAFKFKEDGSGMLDNHVLVANMDTPKAIGRGDKQSENYITTCFTFEPRIDGSWGAGVEYSSLLPCNTDLAYTATGEAFAIDANGRMTVSLSKQKAANDSEVEKWLKDNNFEVIGRLKKSIQTPIPKQLCPTIPLQQMNISLEAGGAVKPNNFKVNVAVDQTAVLKTEIEDIKRQLGAIAAIQHKYI